MRYARFSTEERVERPMRLLRRAAAEGGDLALPAVGAIFLAVVATVSRLAGPLVIRNGVDEGILTGDRAVIGLSAMAYIGFLIVHYGSSAGSLWTITSVGERYLRDLRTRVYRHLMGLDIGFFGRNKAGVIVSRMTSDVEALTAFTNEGALAIVTSTLTVVGVGVGLFITDAALALVVLAVFPLLIGASIIFRYYADRAYRQVREQIGLVLGSLQEGISGVRVVQAYTQEKGQMLRFGRVNDRYYRANLAAARAISTYFPSVDFLRTASIGLVLAIGGARVLDGQSSIGALIAFLLYLNWFFEPIVQLSNVYNLLQSALAALAKLYGILDARSAIAPGARNLDDPRGKIEFSGLTFGYDPDVPVLRDLDLTIPPGQRVAIVGETGAGKSTVAKLAVRFYDPQQGEVLVDGVDLRDLTVESLRATVSMVPQEGFLFDGSVRDNITYSRPEMPDGEVWEVCARLGMTDWVRSLPERLDTPVQERGTRLSSGERQLVSLARAMAADPAIIVLDEATSNLDPETEARVERALGELLAGRTAIVIAHRLQTAQRADRILVMDGGRVVEDGSFEDLLAAKGVFHRLQGVWEASEGVPG